MCGVITSANTPFAFLTTGCLCVQMNTRHSSISRLQSPTLIGVTSVRYVVVSEFIYNIQFSATDLVVLVVSYSLLGWLRGSVVERRSLAGVLSLSCARPVADG